MRKLWLNFQNLRKKWLSRYTSTEYETRLTQESTRHIVKMTRLKTERILQAARDKQSHIQEDLYKAGLAWWLSIKNSSAV